MPSRSFYWRTADGCLEKNEQEEGIAATTLFQPSTPEAQENGFTIDIDDCDPWSKGRDTSEPLGSEMDSFPAQPLDIISENILLDTPLKQNDTPSIPTLNGLNSNLFELTTRDPNHEPWRRSYRGHSLSLSEIRELRDIAMPHYALSNSIQAEDVGSGCSSENEKELQSKKRKSSTGSDVVEPGNLRQTRKQQGHNAIEKRYRSNLNDKIYALRQRVPSLRTITEGVQADANAEGGEGSAAEAGQKFGKAEILTGAVSYISHLEWTVERLGSEVVLLKNRVMAFERLAMSGSILMDKGQNSRASATGTLQRVQAGMLRLQEFML